MSNLMISPRKGLMKPMSWNSPSLAHWLDDVFLEFNKSISKEMEPKVNINENDNSFIVDVAVPGMNKSDFKISVKDNILSISSESKSDSKKDEDGYFFKEFNYSSFNRSIKIPKDVVASEIEATYTDGILKLLSPKNKSRGSTERFIEIT